MRVGPAIAISAALAGLAMTTIAPRAADVAAVVADHLAPPGQLSTEVAITVRRSMPLRVPVEGVERGQLVNTFTDRRGTERAHEAIDILAPRGTAVLAADDGVVVKLFLSKPGGITVYQFDPTRTVAYYYAHLDRYAEGLVEGQALKRGDTLGYVGSTGNADPAAPHLHFAVFELGPEKQWWKGRAINPLPLFDSQAAVPSGVTGGRPPRT